MSAHPCPVIDVAVVGGGPGGLAAAIACARRGLSVVVLERSSFPRDKACGEGLLPPALRALETLGARDGISTAHSMPLLSLRYVQEDGSAAVARLPDGGGLGVRRTALGEALCARARAMGVELREHANVRAHLREPDAMTLSLEEGPPLRARLLVAADGLASPRREAEGLGLPIPDAHRFGMRRHFRCTPWTDGVEIHVSDGAEAYATPIAPDEVGVAILWTRARTGDEKVSYDRLLARFPALAQRLAGAEATSETRGAGPLERRASARVSDRFVLLGDAAGYHDAISGEGLALALMAAVSLGGIVETALAAGGSVASLRSYDLACATRFRKYRAVSTGMLAIARRPALRRRVIYVLSRAPALFDRAVAFGIVG